MEIHQDYLNCLAQASYLVTHGGEACVIDPLRDVDRYLAEAERRGVRIVAVALTHLHADFVSGQCELAERTGARVYVSAAAEAEYPHVPMEDGDELTLGGDGRLVFLATPGHTPESVCILAYGGEGATPLAVFTGDTLFIGGAGRPDLVVSRGRTPEEMAGLHYDSLRAKLLPLPDEVIVYPGHGPGSACGKGMSSETFATLGAQRLTNPALADVTREEFVREAVAELPPAPAYFPHSARTNRAGAVALAELGALVAVDPEEFAARTSAAATGAGAGARVLDVRDAERFGAGHVPGSLNVGLGGQFASWSGSLLPVDAELWIVADDEARAEEARLRLARVGLDRVGGWLAGGVEAWAASGRDLARLRQVDPDEVARALETQGARVLDVRRAGEWAGGTLPGAQQVTLAELEAGASRVQPGTDEAPLIVVCAAGYRSSAACSILERAGHRALWNLRGGMRAWEAAAGPA